MASTGEIAIPGEAWKLSEEVTREVLSIINKYTSTRVEGGRGVYSRVTSGGHERVVGIGAYIEVVGEAPVGPVRDWLRANGFHLSNSISNTIDNEDRVWEQWERTVGESGNSTVIIKVDLGYIVVGDVGRLVIVLVYPIVDWRR